MSGKRMALMPLVLIIALVCSACGGDVIVEPVWVIGVDGAEKPTFSSIDYGELKEVDFGNESRAWQGVYMKDVLEYLGVSEYASITFTDAEGIRTDCPREAIDAAMLVNKINGEHMKGKNDLYYALVIISEDAEEKPLKRITVNQ